MGLCVPAYGIVITWLVKGLLELLRTARSYWTKGYTIVVTWLVKEILKLLRTACSYWIKRGRLSCRLNCTFAWKVPATVLYCTGPTSDNPP